MLSEIEEKYLGLHKKAIEDEQYANSLLSSELKELDPNGEIEKLLIKNGYLNAEFKYGRGGGEEVHYNLQINGKLLSDKAINYLEKL